MQELGVDLEQEDDFAVFMGVTLEKDHSTGLLDMKQTVLIQFVIEAVFLDYGMPKGKFTPLETKPLVKYENGEPVIGIFRYSRVLGIILYLSGNNHPDVSLAVNICSR